MQVERTSGGYSDMLSTEYAKDLYGNRYLKLKRGWEDLV